MRYIHKVTSKALPGRHDEYDRWYRDEHLPEVLAMVPSYIACTRYISATPQEDGRPMFVALYEVEADSVEAVKADLTQAAPSFSITDTLDRSSVTQEVLIPQTDGRQVQRD